MQLEQKGLLRGTILLTFSGFFGQIVGFLYRIALSRMVGAELMGLYQLIMPVYAVLSALTTVGLTVAMSTLSAGFWAKKDIDCIFQLRRMCVRLLCTAFFPLAVLTLLGSDFISTAILGDARTRLGLILLLPCILLTGIENLQKYAFFGTDRVRPPAFSEMAEQLIRSGAVLGLLVLFLPQTAEKTVGLITVGMTICEICSALTLTVLFRVFFGKEKPRDRGEQKSEEKALRGQIIRIALPVGFTALLGNVIGSVNAILIPKRLVFSGQTVSQAMSALGVVNGMTIPMLLMPSAFIGALGLVLVPKLAQNVALGQKREVQEQLSRSISATSVLLLPAMSLLCVLGPRLGEILFKNAHVGDYMEPLALGVTLSCFQSILSSSLNGVGKQSAAARNMLLSDGILLVFTYFLVGIPQIGLSGYVTGLWVSSLVGLVLNWLDLRKATGIRVRVFCWMVAPGLASLLMGLCCRLLFGKLVEVGLSLPLSCVATAVFGVLLYLSALQAQGLRRDQIFSGRTS